MDGSVLQFANSMAIIARDGVFVYPSLTLEPAVRPRERRIASLSNVQVVQEAMRAVIYEVGGTAHQAFNPVGWNEEELSLYGKTGTTNHSLFGGFARSKSGQCLALAVVVEDKEGGGKVAAPIGRRILEICGKLGYLPRSKWEE